MNTHNEKYEQHLLTKLAYLRKEVVLRLSDASASRKELSLTRHLIMDKTEILETMFYSISHLMTISGDIDNDRLTVLPTMIHEVIFICEKISKEVIMIKQECPMDMVAGHVPPPASEEGIKTKTLVLRYLGITGQQPHDLIRSWDSQLLLETGLSGSTTHHGQVKSRCEMEICHLHDVINNVSQVVCLLVAMATLTNQTIPPSLTDFVVNHYRL